MPDLVNAVLTLSDWSFSDGLKTFASANSTSDLPRVSTDAAGRIVSWSIDFSDSSGEIMGSFANGTADQIDQATDFSQGNRLASNTSLPGTWTAVPEPSAGALPFGAFVAAALARGARARFPR